MQKAEFELNLSRSSSGRARSRGLRSPHSKRLGSLEPTVCSLGWFYADTDLRPGPPPRRPPHRPRWRASRARLRRRRNGESFKFGCKATGNRVHPLLRYRRKDSRHCCAPFSFSFSPFFFFFSGSRHAPHAAHLVHTTLDIKRRQSLLIIFIGNWRATGMFWVRDLLHLCTQYLLSDNAVMFLLTQSNALSSILKELSIHNYS